MSVFCEVYEQCGGCALQHITAVEYADKKRNIAKKVLEDLGQDKNTLQPLILGDKAQRRRVELKVRVAKGEVSLGYLAKKSHDLVAISHCPVTAPPINAMLPALEEHIAALKKPGVIEAVQMTSVANGIDMLIITKAALHAKDAEALKAFAEAQTVCRLATTQDRRDVKLLHHGEAVIYFDDVAVSLPISPFLQATKAGEEAIRDVISHNIQGNHIIDLYSGCGTYSLPLAKAGRQVAAYEGNYEMVVALNNAAIAEGIDANITAHQADLFKRPLTAKALQPFESAIINPPRNGALPQIKALAMREMPQVIMVSCNPATFQRDAAHLLNSGYSLQSLTPIDQFYMTHHLELVGVFAFTPQ